MLWWGSDDVVTVLSSTTCVSAIIKPVEEYTAIIKPVAIVHSLRVMFNSTMTLSSHVIYLRRSINFQLRNLWRIHQFIDQNSCHHAVCALITSCLDYCNGLFTILFAKELTRLQRLHNNAASLDWSLQLDEEQTWPISLTPLHQLPVCQRVLFKILLYIFKSIQQVQIPPFHIRRATSVPLGKGTKFALHHGKMSTTSAAQYKFYTLVSFSLLLNVDITISYPNKQTLTVYM